MHRIVIQIIRKKLHLHFFLRHVLLYLGLCVWLLWGTASKLLKNTMRRAVNRIGDLIVYLQHNLKSFWGPNKEFYIHTSYFYLCLEAISL